MAMIATQSTSARILDHLRSLGPGAVFVPPDVRDFGSRGAVDSALRRLRRSGHIRRLAQGVYDLPRVHARYGPLTPPVDQIARAIARGTGEKLVMGPAAAANVLGLTTQVPAKAVYLTNGTTRDLAIGKQIIRFRRATPSSMAGDDSKAGLLLRALRHLGRDGIDDERLARARAVLDDVDRAALAALRRGVPAWLRAVVDGLIAGRRAA